MADLDTAQLLAALEPVAEDNLNRHLNVAQEWMPHEYVPWSLGRDFKELGGDPWSVDQSQLSQIARTALMEQHPREESSNDEEQRHAKDVRRKQQHGDRRTRRVVGHRPDAGDEPRKEREPGVKHHAEQQRERANGVE